MIGTKAEMEPELQKTLSPNAAKIVRMSARAFGAFGREIAEATFARLAADPEAGAVISPATMHRARHPDQFGGEMMALAANMDRIEQVSAVLDRIARRHLKDGFKPEYYGHVQKALLPAIRDVLGEGASDQLLDAWREALDYLATLLIAREDALIRRRRVARAA